ncbi:hypothetical protein LTR95_000693 [Oleoguttula sp. CCFEE 5521]
MDRSQQPTSFRPTGSGDAGNANRLGLTFGIELEFSAVFHDEWLPLKQSGHEYFRQMVVQALDENDITADTAFSDIEMQSENRDNHSLWKLEMDALELSDAEEELLDHPYNVAYPTERLELISRVLCYDHCGWKKEVAKVLSVLNSTASEGSVLLTNHSTGFHIHIGYGTSGVPLRTAKTVLQISLAYERLFDMLYTTDMTRNLFSWLSTVEACDNVMEIGDIFNYGVPTDVGSTARLNGHKSVLNFDNLFTRLTLDNADYRDPKGTIEFREHAGTLDLATIYAHVEICRAVVEYSGQATDVEILQLLARAVRNEDDLDIFTLLAYIGIEPSAIEFHHRRLSDTHQQALQA